MRSLYHCIIIMNINSKHIDQSTQISALQSEVSELKDMLTMMQQIIVTQNKQIRDIHKLLFNSQTKSNIKTKQDKINAVKARILMKG